jgi:K+-sensing histidine kinase KdpD
MEYRLLRNDGVYRWIRHTGAPRIAANGEFEGFIGSSVDVTGIKESQRAVFETKQLEENIDAKNKLIEQFVTDTRNPLESILAMNSLLLDMKLTPEQRSYAEGVQMGTELLVELFSDLYDLTRSEQTKTEFEYNEFNIYEAIEPVVEFISQATRLKKMDLELISFIEPKIPLLNGDLLRIKQIIMNILNNHISHCGDGSVIFIRTRIGSDSDDKVQLKIDFNHISGSFKYMDGNESILTFGEEALGISIARKLVQAMRGEISFGADTGTFCKVKLWLDKSAVKSDFQTLETATDMEDTTSQSDDFEIDLQSSLCGTSVGDNLKSQLLSK